MGTAVMIMSLVQQHWTFDFGQVLLFLALFLCGLGIAYSFLLMLMSTSVWLMRSQSLMEMWWLFSSLMRYPREIFRGPLASPMGWFFTFAVPVLLVISIPAEVMVKAIKPSFVAFMVAVSFALLIVSRQVFRMALRRYRSASS
jgi:ABC-2 type transport system permease protein